MQRLGSQAMSVHLIETPSQQRYHRLANKGSNSHECSVPSWTGARSKDNCGWVRAFQWETPTCLNLGESPSNSLFRPMIKPLWFKRLSFCRRQRGRERTEVGALKTHFPESTIISVHFTSDSQMKNIHSLVKMNSGEVSWRGAKWGTLGTPCHSLHSGVTERLHSCSPLKLDWAVWLGSGHWDVVGNNVNRLFHASPLKISYAISPLYCPLRQQSHKTHTEMLREKHWELQIPYVADSCLRE